MTRSYVYLVPGERDALIRGALGMHLRRFGVSAMWSRIEHGWWVRADSLTDLLAHADVAGLDVVYREHRAPRWRPRRGGGPSVVAPLQ